MEVITEAGLELKEIPLSEDISVSVRAPGMKIAWKIAWRTIDAPPAAMAAEAVESGGWDEAIAENDLTPFAQVEAQPLPADVAEAEVAAAPPLALVMPDSPDRYAEVHVTPPPDEGVLLMVKSDGVVQWYLPTNPLHELVPPPVALNAAGEAVGEPAAPFELRFQVPVSALTTSAAGAGESVGGAILKFFRFKIVKELIGAGVEKVVQWIIDNIEAKHKTEGFRWFDKTKNFALLSDAELQAMSGKRVLLLTHGIFSSLAGAFDGIADPASPVRQHLSAVYGDRIIGWDHWTVAKTPLQNAADLLAKLPAGIQPDIVCHSRGALVTRAMLEHPDLENQRKARFSSVGKAVFIAGANQGSQLATLSNINRLLNIYAAAASLPILGAAGVVLKVVVGVVKVIAQVGSDLPSFAALSVDETKNPFLKALNGELMTPTSEIVVAHANYDPAKGVLAKFLDLNVDAIFKTANDMVVPFTTADVFDKWQQVGTNLRFGTATVTQGEVMHTNFFIQPSIHALLAAQLV